LVARLVEVSEAERRELAGDIHDDPIQKLVAVNMRLQLLRRTLSEPAHHEAVDELLGVVKVSIGSLRNLLFELRPSVLDEDGLAPALVQYLDRWGEGVELAIDNRLTREPPGDTRVICYRIAQEALANVRKHAEASRVDVLLSERDRGFFVRIKDDGRGFDPADGTSDGVPGHLGLASMRERAELAGGWCRVFSLAGGGTTVEFWLPEEAADGAVGSTGTAEAAAAPLTT
jgi:signal transduction histidine kinase